MHIVKLNKEERRQVNAVAFIYELSSGMEGHNFLLSCLLGNLADFMAGEQSDLQYVADQTLSISLGIEMQVVRDQRCGSKIEVEYNPKLVGNGFVGRLMAIYRLQDWVSSFSLDVSELLMCIIDLLDGTQVDLVRAIKQARKITDRHL